MKILNLYFDIFDNLNFFFQIFIQIFFLFLMTYVVSKLIKYLVYIFFKYIIKSSNLDNNFLIIIKKISLFFISILCFLKSTDLILIKLDDKKKIIVNSIRYMFVYILSLIFLLKFIDYVKQYYISNKEKYNYISDYNSLDAFEKLFKILVFIIWTIFFLGKIGINLNTLLAFSGAGGIMIGFASRDLFSNIFGGLMLYLDKPFSVGDWILSPDKNIEGDVDYIGWRQTKILTFEKYPIYVPNSIFSSIIIGNMSRILSRRFREEICIRYADLSKMKKIAEEVKKTLSKHPNINTKYTFVVNFSGYKDGTNILFISTYTNTTDFVRFHEIKQDILLKIGEIIKNNNAEIAFPIKSIYIENKNESNSSIINKENIINE